VEIKEAITQNNLGVSLQRSGTHQEADAAYKQSLAILEAIYGPRHPAVAQSLSNRASLYRDMQVFPEAERVFQIATRIWNEVGWPAEGSGEMEWSEFPQRDRLKVYGERVRGLRQRVIEEEQSGKPGPATAELKTVLGNLGPWFHNVPLTRWIGTRPELPEHPANRWSVIDSFVPKDLSGKTVLDIGVNAGFFSLEMKRRGAARVLGIDIMPHILAQARFTSHWFELPIELLEWDVYDVGALGKFDIVVFLGVMYHLKHPLYALEKIEAVCNSTMYFQSVVRGSGKDFEPAEDYLMSETAVFDLPEYPKLYFIEKSFNGDVSNWWMATRSCLKAMLRVSGFKNVQDTSNTEVFVCKKG
jgi:tRNA (mo5U34)-methyltransferase